MFNTTSKQVAVDLDQADVLKKYRHHFFIPPGKTRPEQLYFTGNSLGLQPKAVQSYIQQELDDWKNLGVEGHFHGKNPWFKYHHFFEKEALVVGAKKEEVVVMNNLTVNLHLLLVSFYRPTSSRFKIIMEAGAFPSDMYAIESQVKHHGLNYDDAVIEIKPRAGEHHLRTEDVCQAINENGDQLALLFFSGVQYYTGQYFDIKALTHAAHAVGAFVGIDCAHAAGNVKLQLHDWGVDFAAWCTYKYMNSGPGGVSGVFVHEKHGNNPEMPRFAGWWGYKESERFQMKRGFKPEPGAAGWQLSNAPIISMATHKAALDLFDEVGMDALVKKGKALNAFLEQIVLDAQEFNQKLAFEIITPEDRGCQLSILTNESGKALFDYLTLNDVIADWREPNVIRLAPVPFYNSFMDVWEFGELLKQF